MMTCTEGDHLLHVLIRAAVSQAGLNADTLGLEVP
jgi:hypothetical protein